jgi:hypothetical protein
MSFVDIVKPEKCYIWTTTSDEVKDKLFEAVPPSWAVEKLDSL